MEEKNSINNKCLVSCVMPTKNRRMFVSQSIKYFQNQDYPNKELIIYDTGTDKVKDLVPNSKEIHYFSSDLELKLGEVRNVAINHSKGDIIITWDDDDWSGENRISKQVQSIIKNEGDLTCFTHSFTYDMNNDQCWLISRKTDEDMTVNATLAFRKRVWEKLVKYPPLSVGEDNKFLRDCLKKELKLVLLPNNGEFISITHQTNTASQIDGHDTNMLSWKKINPPDYFSKDILFYKNLRNRQQTEKELKSTIHEMKEKQVNSDLDIWENMDKLKSRSKELIEKNRNLQLKNKFLRNKNEELRKRLKVKKLKWPKIVNIQNYFNKSWK